MIASDSVNGSSTIKQAKSVLHSHNRCRYLFTEVKGVVIAENQCCYIRFKKGLLTGTCP